MTFGCLTSSISVKIFEIWTTHHKKRGGIRASHRCYRFSSLPGSPLLKSYIPVPRIAPQASVAAIDSKRISSIMASPFFPQYCDLMPSTEPVSLQPIQLSQQQIVKGGATTMGKRDHLIRELFSLH
jgi:hypothetical protein